MQNIMVSQSTQRWYSLGLQGRTSIAHPVGLGGMTKISTDHILVVRSTGFEGQSPWILVLVLLAPHVILGESPNVFVLIYSSTK